MLDFLMISEKKGKSQDTKEEVLFVFPKFIIFGKSKDLMIRGGDFYAIWIEEKQLWSVDEDDALEAIDNLLNEYKRKRESSYPGKIQILYMRDSDSGMIDKWHKYCQKQMRDNYHSLDDTLIFANTDVKKEDYATKRLPYSLEPCDISYYETLISTLYEPSERRKLEWAIGAIVTGDSKKLQKFEVLYGAVGTGKSTIIKIIQMLFDGYCCAFDAKSLGNSNNSFALEPFKANPLVGIQHDGDLSKIEDNTRLNSLISHEEMVVNEKYKSAYASAFKCFLFMGTNKPVKITDAKSGLIRRLIDVSPSGNKLSYSEYQTCMKNVPFELGGIACHCRDVYLEDPNIYDDYIPMNMLGASNDFYNFILENYYTFKNENQVSLKVAWEMYSQYCDSAKVPYPYSQRIFKEELKNYFSEYIETFDDASSKIYNLYRGFKTDKFEIKAKKNSEEKASSWLELNEQKSLLDDALKDCPAQYATRNETPCKKWEEITSKLSDLDTSKLHYVKVPENHIVIDFDLKDSHGDKSFEENVKAASKFPKTYAETSKSGNGIHLHYIYTGNVKKLSRVYDDQIEVKVFTGNSALRRKLTKCNDIPIATISSGLPLKGDDKVVSWEGIQNEKMLRTMIRKNLNKEYHASTKSSVDYIYDLMEDAYDRGIPYDVSDLRGSIVTFAARSTHQSDYCLKLVGKMKFKSENPEAEQVNSQDDILVFFDCEVFPNLFLVNWKAAGEDQKVVRMINPSPSEIENLLRYKLIGFNNRRYDNHMIYARLLGYSEKEIYELSQKIVASPKGEGQKYMFREAYNLSYTDVYDFCSKKQSLKKWEIELGIHHKELGLPWDQPVPKERWEEVAKYCDNDVIATEAVWNDRQADFIAREIQVELVKSLHGITNVSVNNTTNELSTLIIFGKNRNPQNQFNYRDLSKPVGSDQYLDYKEKFGSDYEFRIFDPEGLPTFKKYHGEELPEGYSILPFFPGYTFERGVSTYLGEEIGEGGRVYSEPGMYTNVWDGDIASQHPHSIKEEQLFGPVYTNTFSEIVEARVAIKHGNFDLAATLLGGALAPFLNESQAKDLAQALKIVINSIYGLTSARFPNAFRDPRNIDNIVAKRGALFMTLLKSQVEKLGYQVCHIKTDSIKIPNATESIQEFVVKFGREFGYDFETEAEYVKYCLVNDAVYIAKDKKGKWTAVGAQFQVPYVFKTLFSKEPIQFEDMCETKSVTSALYLDMNEGFPNVTELEAKREKMIKKDPNADLTEINEAIQKGHNYIFVGRVGSFCPVVSGAGGGWLCREAVDNKTGEKKYVSATGAKGYRWMESEMVRELNKQDSIDISYYRNLVDEAISTISQYGDFEWFTSDDDVHEPEPVSTAFDVR